MGHAVECEMDARSPLCAILRQKSLVAVYQPILSLVQRRIVGYEGLSRGVSPETDQWMQPLDMFREAARLDAAVEEWENESAVQTYQPVRADSLKLECPETCGPDFLMREYGTTSHTVALDRLCRDRCLSGFGELLKQDHACHLFLNLDASIIDRVSGSDYLLRQVNQHGIPHGNVIIEINECHVRQVEPLVRFVKRYREEGFLIALDDMGAGFSNLDRISLLEPDIIKLDRSLVQSIADSHHKQEVFKCLVGLANKVGAVVVAEGVETETELNAAMEFGAHLIQGFCFARPVSVDGLASLSLPKRMEEAAIRYMAHMNLKMTLERSNRRMLDQRIGMLAKILEETELEDLEKVLGGFAAGQADVGMECAYLLDEEGIQTTATVFGSLTGSIHKRRGFVFSPTEAGSDNSLKKYYYELVNARVGKYVSDPYISHATGSVCVTHSRIITRKHMERYVLCVDFLQDWNKPGDMP